MADAIDNASNLRGGTATGALAWILGVAIALVFLALFSTVDGGFLDLLATSVVFYYTFHLWPLILVPADLSASAAVFAPIAMLVLFWAGFRAALRAGANGGRDGFVRGAEVAVGYLGMVILSLPAFAISVDGSLLADPLVTAVIVGTTGLAFPLVFGGLGGWIAGR
ncbi:hypothetical protein Hrd1104_04690 [Halorhabdus sp. CBA1104]|uniref:hypothetical protein n=1 Tax=unclassified Halorhabdus TaxID=2621901 RepID=UPI0012B2DC8E|nr:MULTISPECIES: hypothetical protein [unclassified Halorhabdus]QGN06659.1 hypothetical protein Hrd1104_04690 [Halorhabdus sp. CBA1104]